MSDLDEQLENWTKMVGGESGCFPTFLVIGALVPIVLFLALYFMQPSFVQTKDDDGFARSNKKVVMWTIGATLLIWAGMYLFTYCQGYSGHQVCMY